MKSIEESLRFLEAVYGVFGAEDAVSAAAIDEAEARLGISLPRALRVLYARTGASKSLHASHNSIVPVDGIGFEDDHLIFYEENQGAVRWAIPSSRCGDDDPPVVQGVFAESCWSYFPEFESVSDFSAAQGAWQAVQGGLPFVAVLDQPAGAPRVDAVALENALGPAALDAASMRAWLVEGGVVIEAGEGYIGMATREKAKFRAASARIGVDPNEWDYATLQNDE